MDAAARLIVAAYRIPDMSVSIKDIARAAGVSHSTVSRALADSPLIGKERKELVRRLAREMGYSPDASARSLVRGHTHTVGVVVTTIADPFSAEVLDGIEGEAYGNGYSIVLATSHDEFEREIAAVETLRSKRVDAVIVISSRVGALHRDRLDAAGVPVILLNTHSRTPGKQTFSVRVDDVHGARLATEHLLSLGHRRIAHIGGPIGHSPTADRQAGYGAALSAAGVAVDPALVVAGAGRLESGEQALHALRALADPPTAVFCYNDMTAIGLLAASRRDGIRVPHDLAVVGFDDIPFASYMAPALTTVAQPKFEMGQRAIRMALALMSGGAEGMEDVLLTGRLVIRETTGRWRPPDH